MTPPPCACHGEPMLRASLRRDRPHWTCRVKKQERDRAYLLTEKGRARARRFRLGEVTRARRALIQRTEELRNPEVHREDRS